VFVNEPPTAVRRTLDEASLDLVQLSDHEPPDHLRALGERVTSSPNRPDFLLDAAHPTLHGGSGQLADLALAARLAARHWLLLASGPTPDNVAAAIRTVWPWGVWPTE